MSRQELTRQPARCANPECGHEVELVVVVDLTAIERELAALRRLVRDQGRSIMSELDDKLTTIEAALEQLSEDETRELADLQALRDSGQEISPEQAARLDALLAKVQADDDAINTADPAPEPPAA